MASAFDRSVFGGVMTGSAANSWIPVQVAPATQRAYAADWHAFASWCQEHGESALPAEPQTVLQWLTHQVEARYATATITRRLLTVRRAHLVAGHPCPVDTPEVQSYWYLARRHLGTAQRRVEPVTLERLRMMVATCDASPAG